MSAKHDKDNTQIEDEIKKMWSVPSVSCLVLADAGCWKQEGDVSEHAPSHHGSRGARQRHKSWCPQHCQEQTEAEDDYTRGNLRLLLAGGLGWWCRWLQCAGPQQ